jgi:zinc transporter, ZIP family
MSLMELFCNLPPAGQALLASGFMWGMTALGAATVFVAREAKQKMLDAMLGLAAGVLIAASFWLLLEPAIEMSAGRSVPDWFPAVVGFLLGSIFLRVVDKLLPHLRIGFPNNQAEGIKTTWQRSVLLILAITLHNFPEGLAVGVAFGAAAPGMPSASLAGAVALADGIGLQNLPEGLAVALPLRQKGMSRRKSFGMGSYRPWWNQLPRCSVPAPFPSARPAFPML